MSVSTWQFALRLALAISLGSLVGLERQWRQRMAGTRTNALVAAGAAAFLMCGSLLPEDLAARGRVLSYIVSGVGFLGAGVIFKEGGNVRGLNTAATIWCSAAIGALSGLGAARLALVLSAGILLTNLLLRPLAYRLHPILPEATPVETRYEIRLTVADAAATHLRSLLLATIKRAPLTLQGIKSHEGELGETQMAAVIAAAGSNNEAIEEIVLRLSIEDGVTDLSWAVTEASME